MRAFREPKVAVVAAAVLAAALAGGCASQAAENSPAAAFGACSTVASGAAVAGSAVSAAARGDVVCLADGHYGPLRLRAFQPVALRAEHPGEATIGDTSIEGSDVTLAGFQIEGEVTIQPGSKRIAIEHNRITGGYFGIDACLSTSETCDDVRIVGNQLIGPYGEDAIRANRYHDANGDGVGLLIEGNEFSGIRENGNHSDCIQTVWVGDHLVVRRNYFHDNRCQGLFVKDQASSINGIRLEDNLFLRDSAPCAPSFPECGQSNYVNVYGPYSGLRVVRNTIWGGGVTAAFRTQAGPGTAIGSNVVSRLWTDADFSSARLSDNTYCALETALGGSWPRSRPGERLECHPPFANPSVDDFRLEDGRGVDWAPDAQHYGP
jgi:hypothetical protein